MLDQTFIGDVSTALASKRLALVLTKHGVGRGGEIKYLDTAHFTYDPWLDALNTTWTEQKTLASYSCPFVANKSDPYSDVFHALGAYFVVEKGLYRPPSPPSSGLNTHLIPFLMSMRGSGVSRWLTTAIQKYLPDSVPKEDKKKVTAKSCRIGSLTEMAAKDLGLYQSHMRSGHSLGTSQEHYIDRSDPAVSLSAAKALAGFEDIKAPVFLPNLRCVGVSKTTIDDLIAKLAPCSLPAFSPQGNLYPILEASVASLIMYDTEVTADLGPRNAVSLALRDGFKAANISDSRSGRCSWSSQVLVHPHIGRLQEQEPRLPPSNEQ